MDSVQAVQQRYSHLYQATFEELLKEADNLYHHREFEKAYDIYKKIYDKFGHNVQILSKIAICLLWMKEYDQVWSIFTNFPKTTKTDRFAQAVYLYMFNTQRSLENAIKILRDELEFRTNTHATEFEIMEVYGMLAKIIFEYECLSLNKCIESKEMYEKIHDYRQKLLGPRHKETVNVISTLLLLYPRFQLWNQFVPKYLFYLENANTKTLNFKHLMIEKLYKDYMIPDTVLESLIPSLQSILELKSRKFGESHPETLAMKKNLADVYFILKQWNNALSIYQTLVNHFPVKQKLQQIQRRNSSKNAFFKMLLNNYMTGNTNLEKFQKEKANIPISVLKEFTKNTSQDRQKLYQQLQKLKNKKKATNLLQSLLRGEISFQSFKNENLEQIPRQMLISKIQQEKQQISKQQLTDMTKQQLLDFLQKAHQQKKRKQQQKIPQQFRGVKVQDILDPGTEMNIVDFLAQPNKIVIQQNSQFFGMDLQQFSNVYTFQRNFSKTKYKKQDAPTQVFMYSTRPNSFCISRNSFLPLLKAGNNFFSVVTDQSAKLDLVKVDAYYELESLKTYPDEITRYEKIGQGLVLEDMEWSRFQNTQQQKQQQSRFTPPQRQSIQRLVQMGIRRQDAVNILETTNWDLVRARDQLFPQHFDQYQGQSQYLGQGQYQGQGPPPRRADGNYRLNRSTGVWQQVYQDQDQDQDEYQYQYQYQDQF